MKYFVVYFFFFSLLFAKIPKYKDCKNKIEKPLEQTYPIPFLKISPYKKEWFFDV